MQKLGGKVKWRDTMRPTGQAVAFKVWEEIAVKLNCDFEDYQGNPDHKLMKKKDTEEIIADLIKAK